MEIKTRNTNTLMPIALQYLKRHGISESSRNGPVLRAPEPVTICLTHPWERVNFSQERDANPFFHFMESMLMLGGVNDIQWLGHYAKNMLNYSDDGVTQNAFYGTRLRKWHTKQQTHPRGLLHDLIDQLAGVVEVLRKDPLSRQAVALLWDPADLLWNGTKDKACNLMIVFSNDRGYLRMTTFNRSNDAIFGGVCGANIVHFSFFQEYVALALGLPIGPWYHTSNNLHVYTENPKWEALSQVEPAVLDVYDYPVHGYALFPDGQEKKFDTQLSRFLASAKLAWKSNELVVPTETVDMFPFFHLDALHIFNSWQCHKRGDWGLALATARCIHAPDWKIACINWLERRHAK